MNGKMDKKMDKKMGRAIYRYADVAQEWSEKSSGQFRHGAVCVMKNRVVAAGHNCPALPHIIRVREKQGERVL
jgi:hypothetical protein